MAARILVGLGSALLVIGLGLIAVPLAFITAGVLITAIGLLYLDF